ncbi:MAG: DNA repair protein RecO [Acidobacteria bacterium]|nr:DNA repair protein RecO [Acidobacteriota bacterium]
MATIETQGLVLKSYDLADADRIVVFLTHEQGVVRAVAKGSKRLKSRFGSGLEPFSEVHLTYFQKESQELVSLQKIDIISSNFEAASRPEFLEKFAYLADLLLAFSLPHDPNEKLYRMVRACIDSAVARPQALGLLGVYFESWVLRLSGYMADWSRCDGCARVLDDDEMTNLQANFHLMCEQCVKGGWRRPIDPMLRRLASASKRLPPGSFAAEASALSPFVDQYSQILRSMASQAIGREIAPQQNKYNAAA